MHCFAAALLIYSRTSDDAYYLAVSPRSLAVRRAERLEELHWTRGDLFDAPPAAIAALERFVPRPGHTVLQSYVAGVKPFLFDEDVLIAHEITHWKVPAPEWFSRHEAA